MAPIPMSLPQDTRKGVDLPIVTQLNEDGLRYRSKAPGSPFENGFSGMGGTMSCFFCGMHRTPGLRSTQKVLGRSQVVCQPMCDKNPRWRRSG